MAVGVLQSVSVKFSDSPILPRFCNPVTFFHCSAPVFDPPCVRVETFSFEKSTLLKSGWCQQAFVLVLTAWKKLT